MTLLRITGAVITLCFSSTSIAQSVPIGEKSACMEGPLAEFGQYIGDWDIADEQLSQNGSEWTAGAGAQWNFVCIGDGTAIQDFWLPNDGPVGTNLRTYNKESQSWDIAWTIKNMPGPGFAHITAKAEENGNVVMQYVSPIPDPLRKITFFPADENGWHWQLELSTDGGENWLVVYRIVATPSG